jgi:hypothetical protein
MKVKKKRKHMAARTKRGRRSSERYAPISISLSFELRKRVDAWAAKQSDEPARPEAILGSSSWSLADRATKASEMAPREIDRLIDPSVTQQEHQRRKRRLIKGPREFRAVRKRSREG